jgi:hypothetical protein
MLNKIFKLASVVTIGILAAGAPGAAARTASRVSPKKGEIANVHVDEVAHLPLDGMHVNQMFVERLDNNKVYLYLQRPTKEAFAVVDVTNPDKPVLLSRDALQETAGSQVQPPAAGSALAIAFIPERSPASLSLATEPLPTETVQFLDMSDPKNVKSVRTITGVTSVYADDARKLVYLVNGDGLWIVRHFMPPSVHQCGSGDALNPLPDCQ